MSEQQGPMPVFLKTGFSESGTALEDMAREMGNQLRQGLEKLVRYGDFSQLPVTVALLPENFGGEQYVFVLGGFLCRVADLDRFFSSEFEPCVKRMVAELEKHDLTDEATQD